MSRYVFLLLPSFNRVYTKAAGRLAVAELDILREFALRRPDWDAQLIELAGNPYVSFTCEHLQGHEIATLSNLSSIYALYEASADGTLRPIDLQRADLFDDDLLTIQRYSGKTNEQFTKLMVNVAIACSSRGGGRLLDPVCGRGTTLNQALMYGLDASGIELDRRDYESYAIFIKRWVKDKRLKHSVKEATVRHDGASAKRLDIAIGRDKESYKAGKHIALSVANDDTLHAAKHFRRESFNMVVADLPYGVQHGNQRGAQLQRSPLGLLEQALPIWAGLMADGASLVLAWNTLVMSRDDCCRVVDGAGLRVIGSPDASGFEHRVAQAINRDLLVAVKGS